MTARRKREWWPPDPEGVVSRGKKIIDLATEIIDPDPGRRDECREAVEQELAMLAHGETEHRLSLPATKQSKRAARRLGDALRQVQHVYKAVHEDFPFHIDLPTGKIEELISLCKRHEHEPAPRRARTEPEKMAAALTAVDLLAEYGRHKKLTGTRTGQLHRLVCVLLGDRHGNHTFVCRQALAACGQGKNPRARAQPGQK